MSVCDTCENSCNCKSENAVRQLERMGGVSSCSGFKRQEDNTSEYEDFKAKMKRVITSAKGQCDSWVISENGCVITCPNCGERLELCYPDGTEVRYLPHCPWCGKKLEK